MPIDSYTMESRARERIHIQKKSTVCKIKSTGKFLLHSQRKSSGVQHSTTYFPCTAYLPCSSVWSGHEPRKVQNLNLFTLIFLGALTHISPFNPLWFQECKQITNQDFFTNFCVWLSLRQSLVLVLPFPLSKYIKPPVCLSVWPSCSQASLLGCQHPLLPTLALAIFPTLCTWSWTHLKVLCKLAPSLLLKCSWPHQTALIYGCM